MRLLPWFTECYRSPLPLAELLQQVQAHTAPTPASDTPATPTNAQLQGWVKGSSFRVGWVGMRRGRRYQPLAVVEGEVSALATGGSRLRLLHRPLLFALFALGFWLVLFGTLALAALLLGLRGRQGGYASWGSVGGLLALMLGFLVLFWWEVHETHRLLKPLLGLEPLPLA